MDEKAINVMLDLETLGTGPNAVILSIGATCFNIEKGTKPFGDSFYCKIDIQSCLDMNLTVDASTIMWWASNLKEGIGGSTFDREGRYPLGDALMKFKSWYEQTNGLIWGDGDFDTVILKNAFIACSIEIPWNFKKVRCFRTIRKMFPRVEWNSAYVEHSALSDSMAKAEYLVTLFRKYTITEIK